mmetsp:Transcript_3041/g.9365  ORF Transcript_3041/g.9365 Transcript_3041/m.9365 type:complete len:208 (-) Transcript_3041:3642-4265(-)
MDTVRDSVPCSTAPDGPSTKKARITVELSSASTTPSVSTNATVAEKVEPAVFTSAWFTGLLRSCSWFSAEPTTLKSALFLNRTVPLYVMVARSESAMAEMSILTSLNAAAPSNTSDVSVPDSTPSRLMVEGVSTTEPSLVPPALPFTGPKNTSTWRSGSAVYGGVRGSQVEQVATPEYRVYTSTVMSPASSVPFTRRGSPAVTGPQF